MRVRSEECKGITRNEATQARFACDRFPADKSQRVQTVETGNEPDLLIVLKTSVSHVWNSPPATVAPVAVDVVLASTKRLPSWHVKHNDIHLRILPACFHLRLCRLTCNTMQHTNRGMVPAII